MGPSREQTLCFFLSPSEKDFYVGGMNYNWYSSWMDDFCLICRKSEPLSFGKFPWWMRRHLKTNSISVNSFCNTYWIRWYITDTQLYCCSLDDLGKWGYVNISLGISGWCERCCGVCSWCILRNWALLLVGISSCSELLRIETRSLFWQTTFNITKAALLMFEVEPV